MPGFYKAILNPDALMGHHGAGHVVLAPALAGAGPRRPAGERLLVQELSDRSTR